ncbi:MAG: methyltransferase domain-containing protein [Ectothiorhodospiraceae bacterium]|nr:methyltransferase domain-containing protein [Ectothiorhodospiraceae bacterium]
METTATHTEVDRQALESKVKDMYSQVADTPEADFHFEMGRALAERLGYEPTDLDRIPAESVQSFAGVGYHLDLAGIEPGDVVVDLGSGAGMDAFIAALKAGPDGRVIGIDMTEAQRDKARRLAAEAGFRNVEIRDGYIEQPPIGESSVDVVISNGVVNLSADKERVFRSAARALRPGGRLALSDIVTAKQLPETVTCDATLWAACIGGAMQREAYQQAITAAGLRITQIRENHQYRFLTDSAQGASRTFGVKSISLLAVKD